MVKEAEAETREKDEKGEVKLRRCSSPSDGNQANQAKEKEKAMVDLLDQVSPSPSLPCSLDLSLPSPPFLPFSAICPMVGG